ncbi:complex I NDUFA9 subunit family protein [Pararhodobacter aggregans]|uniref:Complex I NDUFA9 subunit family protein n=1 Tax=Pararhodobacter aggregans TaxID=404875 RepID=A0A2T7UTK5_9RHOB|nr:complex I NDUFA9 subunit family protein [Pararhodobacter aggregans]PTX02874.1 NADH dehydrogenase [Pararhodobacter aggregans]PVE48093.1 complex I NDUFA9 subunit family protein [Pararhodobacter aggregans]
MTKLVTILGGSGFVGRYVARRMAQAGWRVRVATRRPNERLYVRTYGFVGQVEPVLCNIRDEASIRAVIRGADAVVNCAGILLESGKNTFDAVQAKGAGTVARLAAEEGVKQLVHLSAIGADAEAESDYSRTKAEGEAAVLAAFPGAVILRPSIIFGPEDDFFNRFAGMTRFSPLLPIAGGKTLFQPVYVDDVAEAAVKGAMGEAPAGVYELGGPEALSFRALMAMMLDMIRRHRVIVNLPNWLASVTATLFGTAQFLTAGLFTNRVLTRDQIRDLGQDRVVAPGAKGLADLGIRPTPMDLILPTYLWRFRPAGQYESIKESASGLRGQE